MVYPLPCQIDLHNKRVEKMCRFMIFIFWIQVQKSVYVFIIKPFIEFVFFNNNNLRDLK